MPIKIRFARVSRDAPDAVALVAAEGKGLSPAGRAYDEAGGGQLTRAIEAAAFTGKAESMLEVLAPQGLKASRIVIAGAGKASKLDEFALEKLGGGIAGKLLGGKEKSATLVFDALEGLELDAALAAARMATGALLRSYRFDKYRTREKDKEEKPRLATLTVQCADPTSARKAFAAMAAVAEGVFLARDLVNEPANVLNPLEFARRARGLAKQGLEVEVLDEREMKKQKMHALLAVGQGSASGSRLLVMQWNGGKSGAKPLAIVGKGVTFDTGGISLKPSSGMEDMKGDMGGAACVAGLMAALAARKAKANVVGVIGLVENMPDGTAQRPGDIVTSMSGQTIEVLNTDAEGRLVLADALWYAQKRFRPRLVIDLATLTGAILVALGQEHAGLFSDDDDLADRLVAAGRASGELVWRLPLAKAYDKMIDSENADMKNIGGRNAGSITAAQFLKRFIKDTAWAHLDVAGTAMKSPKSPINQSWGSGYGVRLLDRLIADNYED